MEKLSQNSDEWLEWRRNGLGASDAPIVMGVSPYSTPYQLWEQKMGLKPGFQGNFATQRGHDLEPKARAMFELEQGEEFPAILAQHEEYDFLRASLDGYNNKVKAVLEIKCPGKEDHKTALDGYVPDKYWPQLQHQLMVTGAEKAYYYSYDGDTGATVEVEPDLEYIKTLLKAEMNFWELIKTQTPPKLTDKDVVVSKDKAALSVAEEYVVLKAEQERIDTEIKRVKKCLTQFADHPRMKFGRLLVTKSIRRGGVDYGKVPQLENVDLQAYRKKPTEVTTFTVQKD